MIEANKTEIIILSLQLVKSDGLTVEEDATVSFRIFDSTGTVELVSNKTANYNDVTQSYLFSLDPQVYWINQKVGTYLVVWSVSGTVDDFNSVYTESLRIDTDDEDIQKILGLVHSNCEIYDTEFDAWHNMKRAKMRLFKDSSKTEVLATYQITAATNNPGSFTTWEQIEI